MVLFRNKYLEYEHSEEQQLLNKIVRIQMGALERTFVDLWQLIPQTTADQFQIQLQWAQVLVQQ